jgi:hypothetical protein
MSFHKLIEDPNYDEEGVLDDFEYSDLELPLEDHTCENFSLIS